MKKNLLCVVLLVFGFCSSVLGQSFIQIRQKSLSEEISSNFTYNVSGGSSYTLNDRPDAVNVIFHISGDGDGGLFAIANASESFSVNPGFIYYKPMGSSQWQNTGNQALKVQGGSNGGYLSLVRTTTTTSALRNTADQIRFRLNGSSAETDITANLAGSRFLAAAHNYNDMLYVLVRTGDKEGTIYKKSVSDALWQSTGITNVQNLSAIPNTNQIVYAKSAAPERNYLFIANNDNTGVVNYGNPIPAWDADPIEEIAVSYGASGQLQLWVLSIRLIYKHEAGTWAEEQGINDMRKLATTAGKMLYTVLLDDASVNIPWRIFARSQDGVYLDDERVQTSFNSNAVTIPVAPGTYTITQSPVTGWHITDIRVNETTTAGTTTNLAGPSATVVVSAGEVVVIEFENQRTTTTNIGQLCGTNFLEDFSSYKNGNWGNPLEGLISYHKATGNFGYGYYAVVSNTDVMSYGDQIYDHTSGDANGSMLLVDATFEKGIFYRRRFTGLLAGAKYSFGAWITNFNPPAGDKPNVSFEIYNTSGTLLAAVSSGEVLTSQWQNFTTSFLSNGNDIELVLRNNTPRTAGNDLAIDDISFGLSIPEAQANTAYNCTSSTGSITVLSPVSAGDAGDFEYSLDGVAWQTETVFANVPLGSHTVYVRYANAPAGSCETSVVVNVVNDCISISGNIWNDANGSVTIDSGEPPVSGDDANNNGGSSVIASEDLFANLVDSDGKVIASVQVTPAGTYAFNNIQEGQEYRVVLSTAISTPGQGLTVGNTPAGWLLTGSNDPVNGINNTNLDFAVNLGVVTATTANVNFGIQRPPVADSKAFEVSNSAFSSTPTPSFPSVVGYQSIPASSSELTGYPTNGSLSGTDPEDCPGSGDCNTGTGTTFTIGTINNNTKLYYNFGGVITELLNGSVIPGFDVNNLVIYAQEGSGSSLDPIGFTYFITDKAGAPSVAVPYQITTQAPLPVSLASFTVTAEHTSVNLSWVTATETNNSGFEVQRSANATQWKSLGFVRSRAVSGNSKEKLAYRFTDNAPLDGNNYYRLKQVDLNGKSEYSLIRAIVIENEQTRISTYPNPVQDQLVIDGLTGQETIQLQDLSGRVITESKNAAGATKTMMNIKSLTNGVYVISIHTLDGSSVSRKVIKSN